METIIKIGLIIGLLVVMPPMIIMAIKGVREFYFG